MRNAQIRTLLAGLVVAASGAALTLVGDTFGITELWPVMLMAAAGLLAGVARLRHALALAAGVLGGAVTVWTDIAVLPATPVGRAAATFTGLLLLVAVTLATGGRLRLSVQMVGWAAAVALIGPAAARVTTGGAVLLTAIAASAVTLLVASGLGLLVAQVTQLVATGTLRRGDRDAAATGPAVMGASVLVAALVAASPVAPAAASADSVDARGLIEHRQTVLRSHASDGTVLGGTVVTRLSATGIGDGEATVVLRDQAVRGLRSLTGLAGPGPLGEQGGPDVVGRTVTHRLSSGTTVRTVATLDRESPFELAVTVTLDGQPTTPAAVVGRSGRLKVTYTLTNTTAEPRELRHFDGAGRARTVTRDVAVPFVGELVVTLDDRYRGVRSADATVGDGMVRAELVLAAPVGAPVRTVTWSADVDDAALPPVHIRLAPVALVDTARGGVDMARLRSTADALRDVSDAAGLARTNATAFARLAESSDSEVDDALAVTTLTILDGLLAASAAAGAGLDEVRALVDAQDARARAGEGAVHRLLDAADVTPASGASSSANGGPRVDATVVYLLDVAGRDEESVPSTFVRLLLAIGLLGAVGLLGRAIGRVTTPEGG